MALGAGFGLAALALATTGAAAQTFQTKNAAGPGQPSASLAKFCDDIKDVFQLAKFTGEYKKQADKFVASGCVGPLPKPRDTDKYNAQRLSTSAFVLHAGGVVLEP